MEPTGSRKGRSLRMKLSIGVKLQAVLFRNLQEAEVGQLELGLGDCHSEQAVDQSGPRSSMYNEK